MRFQTYRSLFPRLPMEAILFFCSSNCENIPTLKLNTVSQFCDYYQKKYASDMPQPQVVDILCQKLSEFGWMSPGRTGTFNAMDNEYITYVSNRNEIENNDNLAARIRSAVYGFPEIFDLYKNSVIPLVVTDKDNDKQIGSSFVLDASTVATAWHCVENASLLSIRGVVKNSDLQIFKHKTSGVDLAILRFPGVPFKSYLPFALSEASVLDDVVIMGYPNIPGYIPNIACEKALISSKLTAIEGHIASQTFEIWSKENVFLITSRVRGGFSGGPVIDQLGQCVGIVARDPMSSDRNEVGQAYDKLGYGVAMPATSLRTLLIEPTMAEQVSTNGIEVEDFQ